MERTDQTFIMDKKKILKRLVPTLATLLGHDGGYIQLETAQHHSGAEELSVHGLRYGESTRKHKYRTKLSPKQKVDKSTYIRTPD